MNCFTVHILEREEAELSKISSAEYRKAINPIVKNECQSLTDKELLTYLLSFSMAPDSAAEAVKKLYSKFGTLSGILSSSIQDLTSVGISASTAILLRLCILQHPVSALETVKKGYVFDTAEKVASFFVKLFAGLSYEKLYILLLTEKYEFIDVVSLNDGVVNSIAYQNRIIVETAIKNHAPVIMLAHNHPFGEGLASDVDTTSTAGISQFCQSVGITLAEHFVVADNSWYPIVLYSPLIPIAVPESFYTKELIESAIDERALI